MPCEVYARLRTRMPASSASLQLVGSRGNFLAAAAISGGSHVVAPRRAPRASDPGSRAADPTQRPRRCAHSRSKRERGRCGSQGPRVLPRAHTPQAVGAAARPPRRSAVRHAMAGGREDAAGAARLEASRRCAHRRAAARWPTAAPIQPPPTPLRGTRRRCRHEPPADRPATTPNSGGRRRPRSAQMARTRTSRRHPARQRKKRMPVRRATTA